MITGDQIAKRIEVAMKAAGYNPRSLADAAKLNPTGVRDILIRKVRDPRYDTLERISSALGISLQQMLYGEEAGPSEIPTMSIPMLDAQLSAGRGAINAEFTEVFDYIPFTQDFFHQKLRKSSVEGLFCVDVRGESMEPTISNGDMLIIDTRHRDLAAGIYAVNYEDESYVKRIEKVGSGFSLVSDNRAYVPISIQGAALEYFSVIGKVLWAGKTF